MDKILTGNEDGVRQILARMSNRARLKRALEQGSCVQINGKTYVPVGTTSICGVDCSISIDPETKEIVAIPVDDTARVEITDEPVSVGIGDIFKTKEDGIYTPIKKEYAAGMYPDSTTNIPGLNIGDKEADELVDVVFEYKDAAEDLLKGIFGSHYAIFTESDTEENIRHMVFIAKQMAGIEEPVVMDKIGILFRVNRRSATSFFGRYADICLPRFPKNVVDGVNDIITGEKASLEAINAAGAVDKMVGIEKMAVVTS